MKRAVVVLTLGLCPAIVLPVPGVSRQHRAEEFLSRELKPLTEYRASRHLEASAAIVSGSLEVRTTLQNRTFTYKILSETGNGYIRHSVLHEFLRREKEKVEKGQNRDIDSFTLDNYTIGSIETAEGGLLKVLARPKWKENQYEECVLFMNPRGEVIRALGKVKSPNFMLSHVVARTRFNQINGVRLPVYLESTAQVFFFGESRFEMRYTYTSVNGTEVKGR